MNIGIIDAEICGKTRHRFPNLVCEKISGFYKQRGDEVTLLLDYNNIKDYDKVFISKVFVKTDIPFEDKHIQKTEQNVSEYYRDNPILNLPNVEYGGTGFFTRSLRDFQKKSSIVCRTIICMTNGLILA